MVKKLFRNRFSFVFSFFFLSFVLLGLGYKFLSLANHNPASALACEAGSSPVVLPASQVYVFTYSGATIPMTDFATVLSPNTTNVQREPFPSGSWQSWFRPASQLATLTSISNGDLLSVGGTVGGVSGFEVGLCGKNSYEPGPPETQETGGVIITTSAPPAGTTTYIYIETDNSHWLLWANHGKRYMMRQDTITPTATLTPTPTNTPTPTLTPTPTVTATPTPLTCDPDKTGASLNKIDDADFALWQAEFIGTTITSKDSDCNHDNVVDIFDFNKMRDIRFFNGH